MNELARGVLAYKLYILGISILSAMSCSNVSSPDQGDRDQPGFQDVEMGDAGVLDPGDVQSDRGLRVEPVMDLPAQAAVNRDFGEDRLAYICEDVSGNRGRRFRLETTSGAGPCGTDFSPDESLTFATFRWIAERDAIEVVAGTQSVDGEAVPVVFERVTPGTLVASGDTMRVEDVPPGAPAVLTTTRWLIDFEVDSELLRVDRFSGR